MNTLSTSFGSFTSLYQLWAKADTVWILTKSPSLFPPNTHWNFHHHCYQWLLELLSFQGGRQRSSHVLKITFPNTFLLSPDEPGRLMDPISVSQKQSPQSKRQIVSLLPVTLASPACCSARLLGVLYHLNCILHAHLSVRGTVGINHFRVTVGNAEHFIFFSVTSRGTQEVTGRQMASFSITTFLKSSLLTILAEKNFKPFPLGRHSSL